MVHVVHTPSIVCLSSVLFGLLHSRYVVGILAGMGFALVFYRPRRLGDVLAANMTTIALIEAYLAVFRSGLYGLEC